MVYAENEECPDGKDNLQRKESSEAADRYMPTVLLKRRGLPSISIQAEITNI
jgi:hypothetical protein